MDCDGSTASAFGRSVALTLWNVAELEAGMICPRKSGPSDEPTKQRPALDEERVDFFKGSYIGDTNLCTLFRFRDTF